MNSVYVVDAMRTPVGKYGGSLAHTRPDDLVAFLLKKLIEKNPTVSPEDIEDVILGAANQAGEDNRDVARMAVLLAGFPVHVGGATVNRLCSSGLQAIIDASRAIACGDGEVYLAGGVESMTRAPFVIAKSSTAFQRTSEVYDTTIGWRFTNKNLAASYPPFTMGETAENVAEKWNISRAEQDAFAFRSQEKYQLAHDSGKFKDELLPVPVKNEKGQEIIFAKDEQPRFSPMEKLASLKPVFKKDGTVTAANSSGINDGAAGLILVSEKYLNKKKLTPLARIKSMAVAGVDPAYMGIGPVFAVKKALKRASLNIGDIDLIELNEAFASQSIACIRDLHLDEVKVNVNGGSIAIGHPLGCSGARISATLLHEMKKRKSRYGIATMCVGVGQGVAIIYERV